MLDLYKLHIFMSVSRDGSFSAAAKSLYMSQSAVSQHIQDLEKSLGTRLFERGRGGVRLTQAGETLAGYAQQILHLAAEAQNALTQVENLSGGELRLGVTPGISVYLMPRWVQNFQSIYPQLGVSLQTNITPAIVDYVLRHQLDLGCVEGEINALDDPRLGHLQLETVQLFVIVGRDHPWWAYETIPFAALAEQPFITRQPNSRTRSWLDALAAQQGVTLRVVAAFDNPESIKRAVCTGMGIAILPDYAIENELQLGRLHKIRLADPDIKLERGLTLIWDAERPFSPISRAFLEQLAPQYPALQNLEVEAAMP